MVWAMAQGEHGDVGPAIEALNDTKVEPGVRAMAAYALHLGDRSAEGRAWTGGKALADWLGARREPVTERTLRIYWRASLGVEGLSDFVPARRDRISDLKDTETKVGEGSHPEQARDYPLRLAWAYRRGIVTQEEVAPLLAGDGLLAAATLEGTRPGAWEIPVQPGMPDLLRLLALTATRDPRPEDLYPLMGSDVAAIRDEACLAAADRFSGEQNDGLIAEAIKDFNDHAKMSGAVLAGLTGRQGELLARAVDAEEVWAVQQIMKLGLWMQGDVEGAGMPEGAKNPTEQSADRLIHGLESGGLGTGVEKGPVPFLSGLLTRGDLPRTTVLLALMHRKQGMAYEYLFNPRGEAWPGLNSLLAYQHWWGVLHRYLPADAPDYWAWGDGGLRQFQLEVLRDWCVVHPPRT